MKACTLALVTGELIARRSLLWVDLVLHSVSVNGDASKTGKPRYEEWFAYVVRWNFDRSVFNLPQEDVTVTLEVHQLGLTVTVLWFYARSHYMKRLPRKAPTQQHIHLREAMDKKVFALGTVEANLEINMINCRQGLVIFPACSDSFTGVVEWFDISGLCRTPLPKDGSQYILYRWTYKSEDVSVVSVHSWSPV